MNHKQEESNKEVPFIRYEESEIRKNVLLFLKGYPRLYSYFGENFLLKILKQYYNRIDANKPAYLIAYFIAFAYQQQHKIFFDELEAMLTYFHSEPHLNIYITTPKNKLKSMKQDDFHGVWSEVIFAYFLHKNGYKINKIGQAKGEAREHADIFTDKGIFEVTVILSKRDYYEPGFVFAGSNEIIYDSIRLANDKISGKEKQNEAKFIVIDCTFMDDLTEKLLSSRYLNIPVDFEVFKKTSKMY